MLKQLAAASACVFALTVAYSVYRAPTKHRAQPSHAAVLAGDDRGAEPAGQPVSSTTAHEQELRQMQQAMLRAMLAASATPPPDDAFAAAGSRKELLDGRLTATPASPELARELQQALDALRAANVAEAVSLGFACGGAMCRVDLKGRNGNLDRTVEQLLDRLPKRFVSSNVLATGAEQRALYVATDQDSLRVAPAGATEVVLPSP